MMFENFHRLYIAIQYCGHIVLLEELHKHLPRKKNLLYQTLAKPKNQNELKKLKTRKIINNNQWGILFPNTKDPDSELFDITLCFILLRNFCPALSTPANGWDKAPLPGDKSTEANFARLKLFRNEFSHGPWNWFISDATFNLKWIELESILKNLGYERIPSAISLKDLKSGPLDVKCQNSITRQKLINETLKLEQKKIKTLFGGGSLFLSFVVVLSSIVSYQYLRPGSWYRYYYCKLGQLQPETSAIFKFIPIRDPYLLASVKGIEFLFEDLMRKTQHFDYIQHQGRYRYFLNIDRCAYGGIRMDDITTGQRAIRGPDVFAMDLDCTSVFYYDEVPPGRWVKYKSSRQVSC